MFRKGSLSGLAQNVQSSRGRAVTVKHEGESFIAGLLQNSAATGTMDDFNELCDHECFSNSVVTDGHSVEINNPHLCAYIAMHAEEIIKSLNSGLDTAAGLRRFSYLHFPPVSNKILPEGDKDYLQQLVLNDPQ